MRGKLLEREAGDSGVVSLFRCRNGSLKMTVVPRLRKSIVVKRSSIIGLSSICILSRMYLRSGEVYNPTLWGNPVRERWAKRKERVKAHVLPLPFVPATWMMFNSLISSS